jgi:hypothetical protein
LADLTAGWLLSFATDKMPVSVDLSEFVLS